MRSCAASCCSKAAAARPLARARTDDTLDRIDSQVRRRPLRRRARQRAALRRRHDAVHDRRPRRTDCAGQTPPKCTRADHRRTPSVPRRLNPRVLAASEAQLPSRARYDPNGEQAVGQLDTGRAGQQCRSPRFPTSRVWRSSRPATVEGALRDAISARTASIARLAAVRRHVRRRAGADGRRHPHLERHPARSARPGTDLATDRADHAAGPCRLGHGQGGHAPRPRHLVVVLLRAKRTSATGTTRKPDRASTTGLEPRLDQAVGASRRRDAVAATSRTSTQAANIDIPVISVLRQRTASPLCPVRIRRFAQSIGACTAPSCDRARPRVVDAANPEPGLPDLRRRRRRVRGLRQRGLRAPGRADGRGQRATTTSSSPLSDFIARNVGAHAGADLRRRLRSTAAPSTIGELVRGVNIASVRAARSVPGRLRLPRRWQRPASVA